jgi:hypothetical protein
MSKLINNYKKIIFFLMVVIMISTSGCIENTSMKTIQVTITVDSQITDYTVEVGTTLQSLISEKNILLNPLDKVIPPLYTVITTDMLVEITRVKEEFETEEITIPFERQTVRNETLPEKQTILIQPGLNGLREITYRVLYENGNLASRTEVRRTDTILSKPEIIMMGVQTPFSPININGKLVYLSSGNAWEMENDTANRRPLLTTGDLDGRVFELSDNTRWLLFTRKSSEFETEKINELWVLDTRSEELTPVYLQIDNVIHFADWVPGFTLAVMASTVEPRSTAPGWQANNNLILITLGADGKPLKNETILESNSGGIYGWWGTNFQYSPNGKLLAYARPDSIGLVNIENGSLEELQFITPFQTKSDWAWVTPISWTPDSLYLFWVNHINDPSSSNPESSPFFDLQAIQLNSRQIINSQKNVGMFAYSSPPSQFANGTFLIIYLQAIFPENSDSSRYRIISMDRDSSNSQTIFPEVDAQGLEPQQVHWMPCETLDNCKISIIYQGNIWLLDVQSKSISQVTGDGLITNLDWE